MTTSEYEIRTATADDWPEVDRVLNESFNYTHNDEASELERTIFEPDRTILATHGDAVVGASAAFTRDLTVPGGVVPAAHVTMVSVDATHRRQGLLNRMIGRLHEDAAGKGEPIAVLWASEGRIYQRYGYGLATRRMTITANSAEVRLLDASDDEGRLRVVKLTDTEPFRRVYEQVAAHRPGWSSRDTRWWTYQVADPTETRGGMTPLRALVHDGPDGPDGYLLWRVKNDWDDNGPQGTASIRELVATNPVAYRALWRFALSVDLTRTTRAGFCAVDEPIVYLVNEPRRLEMRLVDGLWVRLLDVPAALAARRYAAAVDVVIEVDDPRIPANAGRWHLVGDRDSATCTRTDADADLACHVQALGAAYLGGTSLAALSAGGRVRELRNGTLAPASTAWGWHRAPSTTEIF